jgi:hypothetical protein
MPYFKPFPVADESALKRFGGRAQTVVRRCTRTDPSLRPRCATRRTLAEAAPVTRIMLPLTGAAVQFLLQYRKTACLRAWAARGSKWTQRRTQTSYI